MSCIGLESCQAASWVTRRTLLTAEYEVWIYAFTVVLHSYAWTWNESRLCIALQARIHPQCPGSALTDDDCLRLHIALKEVIFVQLCHADTSSWLADGDFALSYLGQIACIQQGDADVGELQAAYACAVLGGHSKD